MLYSFVDAIGSSKYMCVDSSDKWIVASKALDWCQGVTSFIIIVLAYFCYDARTLEDPQLNTLRNRVYAFAAVSVLLLLFVVVAHGIVCKPSSGKCVSSEAAQQAATGVNTYGYSTETVSMIGDTEPLKIYACGNIITPDYFTDPHNSCPAAINQYCGKPDDPSGAYRCMVYACNNIVPGNERRYVMSMLGLVMQVILCLFLVIELNNKIREKPVDDPETPSQGNSDTGAADSTGPPGLLFPRASQSGSAYSALRQRKRPNVFYAPTETLSF